MNNIEYLFSRSPKIGSKLISWGTNLLPHSLPKDKIPSHVAVLVNKTIVIESTMTTGVRIIPYKQWKTINEELYKIPHKASKKCEKLEDLLFEVWGKKYDHLGVLFFAWKILLFWLFKKPIPKRNLFEREDYFFCTEFAGRLSGNSYSMTSPAEMLQSFLTELSSSINSSSSDNDA